MKTPANFKEFSEVLTSSTLLQLAANQWYNGSITGTIGSATEATLQSVPADSNYVDYPDSDGSATQHFTFLTPPSGVVRLYLPSASGTSMTFRASAIAAP